MFVRITNTPRPYAWGSATAIAGLLGTPASGGPEAELWLGTHPGSPARLVDPAPGVETLPEWLAAADSPTLPFLLKLLAAAGPLSLQAHPTPEQARAGFERENAAGIPLDAAHRNYKDPHPKPEIIYALSERFEALCGFRDPRVSAAIVRELGSSPLLEALAVRIEMSPLRDVFEWLITRGPGVDELVAEVVALVGPAGVAAASTGVPKMKENSPESGRISTKPVDSESNSFNLGGQSAETAAATVRMLAAGYPGDPGIVISLLLNRVTLSRGEALYLPAGNIHAYLDGLGVELMTASDNVLRGGLTPKHVDVAELLSVLDFAPQDVPWLSAEQRAGAAVFRPSGAGFELARVAGEARYPDAGAVLEGGAIVMCTAGALTVSGAESTLTLRRGESAYVTASEGALAFAGDGEAFVAAQSAR